jgi:hypothetical protein
VLAKLGQRCTASVEFGSGRDVIVGESLTTHLYTMAMQDRDDAALAEPIATESFVGLTTSATRPTNRSPARARR